MLLKYSFKDDKFLTRTTHVSMNVYEQLVLHLGMTKIPEKHSPLVV